MGFEYTPQNIKNAIFSGDREKLSAAGKKGAKVAAQNREIKKDDQKEADKQYKIEHTYNEILYKDGEEAAGSYLKNLE